MLLVPQTSNATRYSHLLQSSFPSSFYLSKSMPNAAKETPLVHLSSIYHDYTLHTHP